MRHLRFNNIHHVSRKFICGRKEKEIQFKFWWRQSESVDDYELVNQIPILNTFFACEWFHDPSSQELFLYTLKNPQLKLKKQDKIAKSAEGFVKMIQPLTKNYVPERVFNADACGFNVLMLKVYLDRIYNKRPPHTVIRCYL